MADREETDLEKVIRLATQGGQVPVRSYTKTSTTGKSVTVKQAVRGAPGAKGTGSAVTNPGGAIRSNLSSARQGNEANAQIATAMGSRNTVTVGSSNQGRSPLTPDYAAPKTSPIASASSINAESKAESAGASSHTQSVNNAKSLATAQAAAQKAVASATAAATKAAAAAQASAAKATSTTPAAAKVVTTTTPATATTPAITTTTPVAAAPKAVATTAAKATTTPATTATKATATPKATTPTSTAAKTTTTPKATTATTAATKAATTTASKPASASSTAASSTPASSSKATTPAASSSTAAKSATTPASSATKAASAPASAGSSSSPSSSGAGGHGIPGGFPGGLLHGGVNNHPILRRIVTAPARTGKSGSSNSKSDSSKVNTESASEHSKAVRNEILTRKTVQSAGPNSPTKKIAADVDSERNKASRDLAVPESKAPSLVAKNSPLEPNSGSKGKTVAELVPKKSTTAAKDLSSNKALQDAQARYGHQVTNPVTGKDYSHIKELYTSKPPAYLESSGRAAAAKAEKGEELKPEENRALTKLVLHEHGNSLTKTYRAVSSATKLGTSLNERHQALEDAARLRHEHLTGVHHTPEDFHALLSAKAGLIKLKNDVSEASKDASYGRKLDLSMSTKEVIDLQLSMKEAGLPVAIDGKISDDLAAMAMTYLKMGR